MPLTGGIIVADRAGAFLIPVAGSDGTSGDYRISFAEAPIRVEGSALRHHLFAGDTRDELKGLARYDRLNDRDDLAYGGGAAALPGGIEADIVRMGTAPTLPMAASETTSSAAKPTTTSAIRASSGSAIS